MFAVETYAAVRRFVFIEGKSRREAARVFGLSRDTIAKMCRYSAAAGAARARDAPAGLSAIGVADQVDKAAHRLAAGKPLQASRQSAADH